MRRYHFLPLFVAVAFAHSLLATVTLVTDANLADYTGASSITIPAGDTLQFSGISSAYTLSAPISGGGTLLIDGCNGTATLAGDNSSFSGALVVTNSNVTVGNVHALGSATVNIFTDWAVARTFLYTVTGEFPNNITVNSRENVAGTQAFRYYADSGCAVTNSGAVAFSIVDYDKNNSSRKVELGLQSTPKGRLVFTGSLSKNKNGYVYLYSPVTLAATFTSTGLNGGNSFFVNQNCDLILERDVSSFLSGALQVARGDVRFATENCLASGILGMGTTSTPVATAYFDGNDQDIPTVKSPQGKTFSETAQQYTSSDPATLRVTHNFSHNGDSNPGWARLDGHLSFVYDSDGKSEAYCGLNTHSKYSNETDGSITALNGTIHLGDTMRFTALSSLVVTNTGSIALATGQFNDTCDVYLSGTGKLILSNGVTLAVNRVFYKVDDAFVQASAENYTAGAEGVAAYLDSEGTLSVLTSPPVRKIDYHWASEDDTSLTEAANWQENASPDLSAGTAYLHFNAGSSAAEVASDIALYGLEFTRGTDFTLNGTGRIVAVGAGGFTAANTDAGNVHAVTVAPTLGLDWTNNVWTIGANTRVTFAGGLTSALAGRSLTISGGETAVSGNAVTFDGDSSGSPISVAVTNVEKVIVASDTALPAQGLVMYNKLPDFSSVTSNGAPVEIRDIAHQFTEDEVFWRDGVFRQTGLFTLRSRSSTSSHRAAIRITGGEVQFLGGLKLSAARQLFYLSGAAKMRIAGEICDGDAGFDFRGSGVANNEVHSTASVNSTVQTIYLGRVTLVCEAENVLPRGAGTTLSMGIQSDYANATVFARIDLNGYDQTLSGFSVPDYVSMKLKAGSHSCITSATPARFILKRGMNANKQLVNKFSGAVDFEYDAGTGALTLSNVVSDTTGELLVKSGSLTFAYGAGWGGSSNVTVEAGATLKVTDTGAATAFARVGGGSSIVDLKLNSENDSYGKLDLQGNATVRTLRFGETFLPAGDYGSTASGAANTNDDHFTGTGVLHVRRSSIDAGLRVVIR